MRPVGESSAQCPAHKGIFFLGPALPAFLEYPSRAVRQVKKYSEGGAKHRAGLVVCAEVLWPGSSCWLFFPLGLSSLCFC